MIEMSDSDDDKCNCMECYEQPDRSFKLQEVYRSPAAVRGSTTATVHKSTGMRRGFLLSDKSKLDNDEDDPPKTSESPPPSPTKEVIHSKLSKPPPPLAMPETIECEKLVHTEPEPEEPSVEIKCTNCKEKSDLIDMMNQGAFKVMCTDGCILTLHRTCFEQALGSGKKKELKSCVCPTDGCGCSVAVINHRTPGKTSEFLLWLRCEVKEVEKKKTEKVKEVKKKEKEKHKKDVMRREDEEENTPPPHTVPTHTVEEKPLFSLALPTKATEEESKKPFVKPLSADLDARPIERKEDAVMSKYAVKETTNKETRRKNKKEVRQVMLPGLTVKGQRGKYEEEDTWTTPSNAVNEEEGTNGNGFVSEMEPITDGPYGFAMPQEIVHPMDNGLYNTPPLNMMGGGYGAPPSFQHPIPRGNGGVFAPRHMSEDGSRFSQEEYQQHYPIPYQHNSQPIQQQHHYENRSGTFSSESLSTDEPPLDENPFDYPCLENDDVRARRKVINFFELHTAVLEENATLFGSSKINLDQLKGLLETFLELQFTGEEIEKRKMINTLRAIFMGEVEKDIIPFMIDLQCFKYGYEGGQLFAGVKEERRRRREREEELRREREEEERRRKEKEEYEKRKAQEEVRIQVEILEEKKRRQREEEKKMELMERKINEEKERRREEEERRREMEERRQREEDERREAYERKMKEEREKREEEEKRRMEEEEEERRIIWEENERRKEEKKREEKEKREKMSEDEVRRLNEKKKKEEEERQRKIDERLRIEEDRKKEEERMEEERKKKGEEKKWKDKKSMQKELERQTREAAYTFSRKHQAEGSSDDSSPERKPVVSGSTTLPPAPPSSSSSSSFSHFIAAAPFVPRTASSLKPNLNPDAPAFVPSHSSVEERPPLVDAKGATVDEQWLHTNAKTMNEREEEINQLNRKVAELEMEKKRLEEEAIVKEKERMAIEKSMNEINNERMSTIHRLENDGKANKEAMGWKDQRISELVHESQEKSAQLSQIAAHYNSRLEDMKAKCQDMNTMVNLEKREKNRLAESIERMDEKQKKEKLVRKTMCAKNALILCTDIINRLMVDAEAVVMTHMFMELQSKWSKHHRLLSLTLDSVNDGGSIDWEWILSLEEPSMPRETDQLVEECYVYHYQTMHILSFRLASIVKRCLKEYNRVYLDSYIIGIIQKWMRIHKDPTKIEAKVPQVANMVAQAMGDEPLFPPKYISIPVCTPSSNGPSASSSLRPSSVPSGGLRLNMGENSNAARHNALSNETKGWKKPSDKIREVELHGHECSICLEPTVGGVISYCEHSSCREPYHNTCLNDYWDKGYRNCPRCRTPMPPRDAYPALG